jgi:hypothetical protein
MWINLADPIGDGRAVGFDSDSLGGLNACCYWSSLQGGVGTAWSQFFTTGNQTDALNKGGTRSVRAVRAF